eukprot:scaffold37574_cov57-Attheya_sp.AAC.1
MNTQDEKVRVNDYEENDDRMPAHNKADESKVVTKKASKTSSKSIRNAMDNEHSVKGTGQYNPGYGATSLSVIHMKNHPWHQLAPRAT